MPKGEHFKNPDHNRGKGSLGRSNFKKGMRYREAIRKALLQYEKGEVKAGQALDAIARRLVHEALTSEDPQMVKFAMQEIGNRLDGKPTEHKVIDKSVTAHVEGLSEAAGILRRFAGFGETYTLEGVVSDGPLLPAPVCVGPEGHGEGVGIPEVPGGTGES